MNVTESCHLQTLLRFVLGLSPIEPFPSGAPREPGHVKQAAAWLADRAKQTLGAGLNGDDVRKAWAQKFPDAPAPKSKRKSR